MGSTQPAPGTDLPAAQPPALPWDLVQIDGSDHHWFEDRGPACSLLVYVDDATSQILKLHFIHSESPFSYFEATHVYIR